MSLDGLAVRALANELENALAGGRIDRVSQPSRHLLVLSLRQGGKNKKLLCDIHPKTARLVLTDAPPTSDGHEAPLFCMVLRKYLVGARIDAVRQVDDERILEMHCIGKSEIGEPLLLRFVVELMGKHANAFLLDENDKILDAMHRVGEGSNQYRQAQPGLTYILPPPQHKLSIATLSADTLAERMQGDDHAKPQAKHVLLRQVAGIGPQSAYEALVRAGIDPEQSADSLGLIDYQRLEKALQSMYTPPWQPTAYTDASGHVQYFAPFPLASHQGEATQAYESMSRLLDQFFALRAKDERFSQKKSALERIVRHELERCHKKLALQQETVDRAEDSDIYRIYGELLTANLYQIKQGSEATVINFYDPQGAMVTIPMDANRTPNENAQRYFKRYQKAKNGAEKAEAILKQTLEEIRYLESIALFIEQANQLEDLAEVRKELEDAGYAKRTVVSKQKKNKKTAAPPMHILHLHYEDYDIYVGKNNRQNDYVTQKIGSGRDLWLHTQAIHGAHVIIKSKGGDIPDQVQEAAALLAAYFSKARHSAQVPVDATLRRFVHKPNGAKPGMVIYTDQKTIYVTPTEEAIQQLLRHEVTE